MLGRERKIWLIASGLAIAAAIAWVTLGENQTRDLRLRPDDATLIATGETLYGEHCAACHGANLEGQPNWQVRLASGRLPAPPHDETGHTWHHPDAQLFELTKYGSAALVGGDYETDMPGYDGLLSDEQIIAVLSFIKSRWPADIRERHDRMSPSAGG